MHTKSPRIVIILVALLAAFQVIRVMAYPIVQDALSGANAEAWLFPAMTDVFIGITALFIAFGIWRGRGLLIWTSAIVFFAISISDHLDAMSVVLTSKGPAPAMMSGGAAAMVPQLSVMILLEVLAIVALAWKPMRDHYLASKTV